MVIVPDAGTEQHNELTELSSRNIDVIVLDHHLSQNVLQDEKVIIVNNQISPLFENKSLSGAGVTFKFVQEYARQNNIDLGYKYYDLAAVGVSNCPNIFFH